MFEFNRTRLECKSTSISKKDLLEDLFNRTRLECKCILSHCFPSYRNKFNRTRLECKCTFRNLLIHSCIYLIELD